MTNVQKEACKNAIPGYCRAKNITYNELAVKCGVGSKVVTYIVSEMWGNIDNKVFRKVWNVVNPENMGGHTNE